MAWTREMSYRKNKLLTENMKQEIKDGNKTEYTQVKR